MPPARRPRLARAGGPRARHRGQRVCPLESAAAAEVESETAAAAFSESESEAAAHRATDEGGCSEAAPGHAASAAASEAGGPANAAATAEAAEAGPGEHAGGRDSECGDPESSEWQASAAPAGLATAVWDGSSVLPVPPLLAPVSPSPLEAAGGWLAFPSVLIYIYMYIKYII